MPAEGGNCEEVLVQFTAAGIDVDALAAQLQDDGAKSFAKSWNELMAMITSKTAALKKAAGNRDEGIDLSKEMTMFYTGMRIRHESAGC